MKAYGAGIAATLLLIGCLGGSCDVDGNRDAAFEARYRGDADVPTLAGVLREQGWTVIAEDATSLLARSPDRSDRSLPPTDHPVNETLSFVVSVHDGSGAAEGTVSLRGETSREVDSVEVAEEMLRPHVNDLLLLLGPHLGEPSTPVTYEGGPVC